MSDEEKRKPILYISGPYSAGDVVMNVRGAVQIASVARRRGWLPFCPHLFHLWHMIEPHHYEYWLRMCLEWIDVADAVFRLEGESPGADREIAKAKALGKPIYSGFVPKAEEVMP